MTVQDETCRGQGHLLLAGHFLQGCLDVVQQRQDLRDCYLVAVRHVHSD